MSLQTGREFRLCSMWSMPFPAGLRSKACNSHLIAFSAQASGFYAMRYLWITDQNCKLLRLPLRKDQRSFLTFGALRFQPFLLFMEIYLNGFLFRCIYLNDTESFSPSYTDPVRIWISRNRLVFGYITIPLDGSCPRTDSTHIVYARQRGSPLGY